MEIIDKFKSIFSKKDKPDVVEFCESLYLAIINEEMKWFDDKESMISYIESYTKTNSIYSLSMFRYDMFNLIK